MYANTTGTIYVILFIFILNQLNNYYIL